ncbi:phosphate ABC transporter permease subunit PstC [Aureibacillus halotolerans]|uniref:Phosphate transport system permease protein n=1 Tax=Aureibacillus halotolerans TaxID=1508390 RepID=A0A4R6U8T8_9BACI|nr:phosphate ABC transporter permease subunit PstC [Aureibacillus halotolerans]TDQ42988.1 phosphate ABC transporter membrane protein 1 (PhoT family) [Aureibacillus halotolerans]
MNRTNQNESIAEIIERKKSKSNWLGNFIEKAIPVVLWLAAVISILTTVGIIFTLLKETSSFFSEVSILQFITDLNWYPFFEADPEFGILPLLSGTLLVAVIAMFVAIPFGLATAIYLSEYASESVRRSIKPILEVLAGIPTIVYGYFALTFVTPLLQTIIPDLPFFNALSPGIVVGIMIIPMVASLSEDAMSAVPNAMREGALALGSTRLEVALKVVLPAALSGVIASFVLAISRAIGETMIVTIAGGSSPTLTFDPTDSIQTMTAFIVQASLGDASYGSIIYFSIYAVGITLFIFTLIINMIAQYISKRFRESY